MHLTGFWEFEQLQKQHTNSTQLNEQQQTQMQEQALAAAQLQLQLQQAQALLATADAARTDATQVAVEHSARERAAWSLAQASLESKQDCEVCPSATYM